MTQFVERMQQCMGIRALSSVDPSAPSVLIVDREYDQGRAMVNAPDVVRAVRGALAARFLPGVADARLVRFRVCALLWLCM